MTLRVGSLYRLIGEIRKKPGLTIAKTVLDEIWPDSRYDPAKFIAEESGTILEYDLQGNPRFMPKDAVEAERIRENDSHRSTSNS